MMWWTYQQLRSRNLKTRLAAVAKLAASKGKEAVEPLLFALKDSQAEVRSAAAMALGQFQDARSLQPLIKLLQDPVPLVRSTVIQSLVQWQDPAVTNALVGVLGDTDPAVSLRAARCLDQLGWTPGDDVSRKAYVLALGNVERVAELGAEGIQPLVEMLNKGTPERQIAAVKAMRAISDPRISGLMQEALNRDNAMVRLAALETLEQMADPAAFEAVARLFKDKASNIRAAAVVAAARCDGPRAVPVFVEMLKDTSWEVRFEVVKALGRLGDVAAVEGLCRALHDKDHDVRESAALALGRLGDVRAVSALVMALLDEESFVRTAAHNSLFRLDRYWKKSDAARSVLPQVKAARNHREYWISHSAEKLLEQIQPQPDAAEAVAARAATLRTSGPNGQPKTNAPHPAFAILADMLRDPDRDLRLAAAEAFGDLREPSAARNLTIASKDDDLLVRQAAERALAGLN
jgi:HEAT repeat protein